MSLLFEPITLGDITLKNRIIMAPLTRCRAPERLPNALMQEYYQQRASAGLILTEATAITPSAVGYADTPGIWSEAQIAAWQKITEAVHGVDGKIVLQLWHVGRISHPTFLHGQLPVAPSAVQPKGQVSLLRPKQNYVMPRALTTEEVKQIIEDYKQAAINAKKAGFDGVELHAANGYLVDQFLQSSTNLREDEYGGSLENRARFLFEVVDALVQVWGAGRVGVHLSPRCDAHDMGDANPKETFSYVLQKFNAYKLAFVFLREHQQSAGLLAHLRTVYTGNIIANENLDKSSAETLLEAKKADAVAFGHLYIANPDLPERFLQDKYNLLQSDTIYAQGALGYTDYPFL